MNLLIKDAMIVDGSGRKAFHGSIRVNGERITEIAERTSTGRADVVIDAAGLVACPGFIDMHSHSGISLLINPLAESKIRQGVTTEVIGNCGGSPAPLNDLLKEEIRKTTPLLEEAKLELSWSTIREYTNLITTKGVAVNIASLVGNGNIRASVLGFEHRPPTREELDDMKEILAQAMEDGAFGMSTGLIYPPSCYSDTDELVELACVVAEFGGIYASHIRGEAATLIEAVEEALQIGERANVPVEISHHKASGKANWGKVQQTIQMMEERRERGVNVTCDVYPYTAASTGLDALLPPSSYEGGVERLIERLKDVNTRRKIKEQMMGEQGPDSLGAPDWQNIMISYCEGHPDFEGKTIDILAEEKNMTPLDFVFDLLIEEKASVGIVLFTMCEEDMLHVLTHPLTMIGSDSSTCAPYGVLRKGKPHPRTYGTFPRVLGRYVREKGILSLEQAIQKMTSLPAEKAKLKRRGIIQEGAWADIVLFDRRQIIDVATYQEPHRYPKGIKYVLVNGELVIDRSEHTKALPGKVLNLQLDTERF